MHRKIFSFVCRLALSAMLVASLSAQTSQMIPFSGAAPGQPDGSPDVTFKLYDAASGGNYLGYTDTQPAGTVAIATEAYSAVLGAGSGGPVPAAPLAANASVYIAIELTANPGVEIGPRVPLYASGYALRTQSAANADQLGGVPASGYLQTTGGSLSGSSAASVVSVTNTGTGSALLASSQSATGVAGLFQNTAGGDLLQGRSYSGATVFRLFNNGGASFSGNVSIGGASFSGNVSVAPNSTGFGLRIDQGSNGDGFLTYVNTMSDARTVLAAASNALGGLYVKGSGNVGIGTTSPQAALHVNGNIHYGQLTKLDVAPEFAATVRAGDFLFGHPTRRGNPGRALVDSRVGGRRELILNFARDWDDTTIDGENTTILGHLGVGIPNIYNWRLVLPNDTNGAGLARGWLTYSSRRWKENIIPIDDALGKVERLRGVYYDWRETRRHDIGLIAEEVGEVVPEVVTYEADGREAQSVDYARLTALLVEAIKAQQTQIKNLRSEIQQLKAARPSQQ